VVFGLRVERFAGVLGQYRTLDHLNLRENGIKDVGAEGLARVLTKCAKLLHKTNHKFSV
jgi:hypothetical protein